MEIALQDRRSQFLRDQDQINGGRKRAPLPRLSPSLEEAPQVVVAHEANYWVCLALACRSNVITPPNLIMAVEVSEQHHIYTHAHSLSSFSYGLS